MQTHPADTQLARLLSLASHELRTPISVVAGYLRMVLKAPAGTLDERYRRMLEDAEKSCARLSALVAEISDLAALEEGTASFKTSPINVQELLKEAIAGLAPLTDRRVDVELKPDPSPAMIHGDKPRLLAATTSILYALRREVVASDKLLVIERVAPFQGSLASWIRIAEAENIQAVSGSAVNDLATFDEWRGGCGLSLVIARRIVERHQGAIWSPGKGIKAAAVIALPHQSASPSGSSVSAGSTGHSR
jgi:signal transduction histidine kinase